MKKDSIIQFVCFATNLDTDTFIPGWEKFAKKLMDKHAEPSLQQLVTDTKARYRYISQHEWHNSDFDFRFMKDRKSEHFPEQQVKVVQIGGYIPVQFTKRYDADENQVKVFAFLSHNETDIDFYKQLSRNGHLDIYQAFYESCSYGYVLEFFIPDADAEALMLQLKQRLTVEAGVYKECFVPHI